MSDEQKIRLLVCLLKKAELFVTDEDLKRRIGNVLWEFSLKEVKYGT